MTQPLLPAARRAALAVGAAFLLVTNLAAQPSKRVLVIGIDGAGGRYVQTAHTPTLDTLASAGTARYDFLNEGALTPNAPDPFGASGVNWSTILTGASAQRHGVVDNSFAGAQFETTPHFFQHAKQHDGDLFTASLANWTPINTHITPDAYTDLEVGYDIGLTLTQDAQVKTDAVALLSQGDPDAVFLQFDNVDHAGHAYSWGSSEHIESIETVDGLIGEVLAAIDARPGVATGEEDWLVLVTADHGAAPGEFGHYASQGLPNWEVPFIAAGPSVEAGAPMQQGTLRDIAATALWHLGVDPFLAGLDGTVRGLTIEPPTGVVGDFNGDGLFAGDGTGPAASDDVTTFLDHWLATGGGGVPDRYARGDVNLDGRTDLADWALVNRLDPSAGRAITRALAGVPEPAAASLLMLGLAVTPARRPLRTPVRRASRGSSGPSASG